VSPVDLQKKLSEDGQRAPLPDCLSAERELDCLHAANVVTQGRGFRVSRSYVSSRQRSALTSEKANIGDMAALVGCACEIRGYPEFILARTSAL
jgi:hypothetical protein